MNNDIAYAEAVIKLCWLIGAGLAVTLAIDGIAWAWGERERMKFSRGARD